MYIGSITNKGGRVIYQGTPEETPERAALVCFRDYAGKPPKVVSTCRAYRDPAGNWQGNGSDMRWFRRDQVWRDPPAACDVGMFGDGAKQSSMF